MKRCLNCGIEVGGTGQTCPLCQNRLEGENTPDNWPVLEKFRKQALLYKIQLFVVLVIIAVSMSLDLLLDLNNGKHYSIMIAVGLVVFELVLRGFLKKNVVVAKIVSNSAMHLALYLIVVGWYYDFLGAVIFFVVPILFMGTLIVEFIFTMVDKKGNALVYLLSELLVSIVCYFLIITIQRFRPITWTITFMISIVVLIAIIVFKGRKTITEIQKRMNF